MQREHDRSRWTASIGAHAAETETERGLFRSRHTAVVLGRANARPITPASCNVRAARHSRNSCRLPFFLGTVPSARKSPERNWDRYRWTLVAQAEHSTPDPSVRASEFYVDNESGGRPVAPDKKTGRVWSLSELKPPTKPWCSGQDRSNSFVPIIFRRAGPNS